MIREKSARSQSVGKDCRCSKIMSPLNCNQTLSPCKDGDHESERVQRVKVIENAAGGRLSVREASRLLQLSERQVQRLKRRYQPDSLAWVQHGNRGRCMPWAVSIPQKQLILSLARGKYQGFNDSHLAEKTSHRREPRGQPRDRAPPLARCQTAVAAEAPAAPVSLSPATPPTLRHDGAHRCQSARLARRPRPPAHSHRLSG